jgi:hypothetical protein
MIRRALCTACFWLFTTANAPAAASEAAAEPRAPERIKVVETADFRPAPRGDRHERRRPVRVSFPTYEGPGFAYFAAPALNGVSVDSCLDGRLARCGAPAADAFCRRAGLFKARAFSTAFGRGPTMKADTARYDGDGRRGSLSGVTCVI